MEVVEEIFLSSRLNRYLYGSTFYKRRDSHTTVEVHLNNPETLKEGQEKHSVKPLREEWGKTLEGETH